LFLVDELVEILGRALSPGVNDPFTAIGCIQWLHVALQELAKRHIPEAYRHDDLGKLRLIAYPISFERFASAVFDQSRQYVSTDRNATLQMMRILAELGADIENDDHRQVIVHHLDRLAAAAQESLSLSADREEVALRHRMTKQLIADRSLREKLRNEQSWFGGSA
jgi:uncharacterized membrane protein